ncbi:MULTISPECIES: outer membrane protein [Flammeovirga]|uniref:Outer membrane beta-barrel protein n=1 Tax=Flammeovirga agarivorans TaxID=2726742 RepID=A0A7X8SIQ2_9BACT|nr:MULTISPECIES: outer membrane beta-barrel protein [Flammeovirga]NLR90818.1 outer membrane beta-barrel protein [Flammeovirga agarivorans]
MKKLLFSFLFAFLCSLTLINVTSAQSFRIGGGVGNTFAEHKLTDISGDDFKVNDNALAWKVFAGVGNKFLGIEGGYRSLGKVKDSSSGNTYESKVTGWDVAARGKLQIGPIFGFAKAGAFFAKYDNSVSGGQTASDSDNETKFLWGVGAGVMLGMFEVRLEWEAMDLSSDAHLSTLGLSGVLHFGGDE